MKNILLIMPISTLDFGNSTTGGVDTVCQLLLKDLFNSKHPDYNFRILAFDTTSKSDFKPSVRKISSNVEIVRVPYNENIFGIKAPAILTNFFRVRKEINRFRPAIVHSHLAPWLLGVSGAIRIATLHSYKKIARKPISFLNDYFYASFLPWFCDFYIDHYTCVGALLESAVKHDVKTPVSIIGNPLNSSYFSMARRSNESVKVKFITCALLTRRKRIDAVIELVVRLHQAGLNVELTIVGPNSDSQYWQELHDLVEQENANQYITFTGSKTTDEIKTLYAQSDVGIFLSSEETFGLAPLEMLASGLPLISSNVGIIEERPEFFTDIGTCIIDPEKQDDALAKAIEFINKPPVVNTEVLKSEFSVDAVNNKYFSIYKTLLNA